MTGRGRFNGDMLVLARTLREMTQAELALAAEVTQARISKVEHGLAQPSPELISKVASALRMPSSFFYKPGHIYSLPVRHHRKRAAVSKRTLDRVHAEVTLRSMQIAELLKSVDIETDTDWRVPDLDLDETGLTPVTAAQLVRQQWSLPKGPVENLTEVLERAGVIVVPWAFGSTQLDAIGMRMTGLPPLMFVNTEMPTDRMRYTLAHELGHLVMHSVPRDDMEAEANMFASELLMPGSEIAADLRNVTIERLGFLKRVWRVSMQALLMRAEQLRSVSKSWAARIWKTMSVNGWRRREPPELDIAPEVPMTLSNLIGFHLKNLGFDLQDLGRILDVNLEDLQRMYFPSRGLRLVG